MSNEEVKHYYVSLKHLRGFDIAYAGFSNSESQATLDAVTHCVVNNPDIDIRDLYESRIVSVTKRDVVMSFKEIPYEAALVHQQIHGMNPKEM